MVCIFGICGAMRTDEFTRVTPNDIEKHGSLFLVKIGKTKTKISRSFTINGGFAEIVQKYMNLRPLKMQTNDRFFVNYQRGKCTLQFMGRNKFANMPRRVAEFLQLPETQRYTGEFCTNKYMAVLQYTVLQIERSAFTFRSLVSAHFGHIFG